MKGKIKIQPYSREMKLSDIVISDSSLLTILERLGISLGFGEATVNEICSRYNLSAQLFLIICNIYSFENYKPDITALDGRDIDKLIMYLKKSHLYYSRKCFPHLHDKIHKMLDKCDELNKKILNDFYDKYDSEVSNHFKYEEEIVFPYIEALAKGKKSEKSHYGIEQFERNHSNIEEKLGDLRNIIIKYLPEQYSNELRYKILAEIFDMESDLRKHTLLENLLLIPSVLKLEQNGK